MLRSDPAVEETVKYGMPCFVYKGKVFCYLWFDKKTNEPYFLMVEGKLLNHPQLETGYRVRMKILRLEASKDLPIETINRVLQESLDFYRSGTIKTKKQESPIS